MGYGYNFTIALEELEELEKEPEIYSATKQEFQVLYKDLTKDDWFPRFGYPETSGALGYGTGDSGEHPLPDLLRFTSQFPNLTFVVFFIYWDHLNMTVYRLRGNKLLQRWDYSFEDLPFGKVKAALYIRDISSDYEITDLFEEVNKNL